MAYGLKYTRLKACDKGDDAVVYIPAIKKWVVRKRHRPGGDRGSMRTVAAFSTKEEAQAFELSIRP